MRLYKAKLTIHSLSIKPFFKKYCNGLVESVDLIFRILCQISGQDNIGYKFQNHIGTFRSKSFVFVVFVILIGKKITVEILVLTKVLFVTAILTIALRCEVKIQLTP